MATQALLNPASVEEAFQPKFHVVFLATSTEEKVRDFNIVAQNNHLPLKFFNMGDLVNDMDEVLHNTLEDGDNADQNAQKKIQGVQDKIEKCRNDPAAVALFCRKHGIAYAPERAWFATEDSGVNMPVEIWDNIPPKIFEVLPEEVRQRLKAQSLGPGVDTAPFLSATLGSSNIEQIMDAGLAEYAKKQDYFIDLSDLRFSEESVLKLQPMLPKIEKGVDGQEVPIFPILTAAGKATNSFAPNPYVLEDAVGGRISNYHFAAPRNANPGKKTAAEMGVEYIAHRGSRSKTVMDLIGKINDFVSPEHWLIKATGAQKYDLVTDIAASPEDFNVGVVNACAADDASLLLDKLEEQDDHLHMFISSLDEKPKSHLCDIEKATFYLSYPERLLEKSDGLVLLPDSAQSGPKMSLEEKLYILQSVVVAKQLIPRDKHKPVVIVNTDHSWDEAISIHTALAKCQMTKDHALPLAYKFQNSSAGDVKPDINVEASANGYFHTINGGNYEDGVKAAAFIMKDKSLTYHRVQTTPGKTSAEGDSPYKLDLNKKYPKNQVAIFCSASSENAPLNRFVSEISRKLVAAGKRIVCGGGDRYTMGAILDGVKQYRAELLDLPDKKRKEKAYIAGISTYPIAAAETNTGEMSQDYSYRELVGDIYERMAKMLVPAETVVVAPGGAGTIQEWMGFNLLKQKMPDLFNNKKLVIFDPDLMTNPERAVLEEESVTEPTSLQNSVFDKVLDKLYNTDKLKSFRFSSQFRRDQDVESHIHLAHKVDHVVGVCSPQPSIAV